MTEDQQVGGIFEVGAVARYFTKVSVQKRFDALEDDDAVEDGNEIFPSLGVPAPTHQADLPIILPPKSGLRIQPGRCSMGAEVFEKRLEAAYGSPTVQP